MGLPITCHTTHFGTLGQIDPSHLAAIAEQGYKSVINNRPDGEGGPDQPTNAEIQAEAEKLGFEKIILSKYNAKSLVNLKSSIQIIALGKVEELYQLLF
jgi:uncharacterized protein (TIGR01244 family)